MRLPNLRVFGNPNSYSGYGNATQNLCLSISNSSVLSRFNFSRANHSFQEKINSLKIVPDIDLYIQTPPFKKHKSQYYKIGYFFWEADILPKVWAKDIRKSLNEIWVPCELTKRSCRLAGFRGPIEILPTPTDVNNLGEKLWFKNLGDNYVLSDNVFKFYSIFQWNERKGYKELLRSYLKEFSSKENVILILKVNPINHPNHGLAKIKSDILKIKRSLSTKKGGLPKILLITKRISREQILSIHNSCDAFVLPHYGEGWGMPIHDAINHKNFIITTKFGGITEWLDNKNSFIIDHELAAVSPMNWNPWYSSYQTWAKPSEESTRKMMRECFEGKEDNDYKRQNLSDIINNFSIEKCSENIESILSKERFEKITRV